MKKVLGAAALCAVLFLHGCSTGVIMPPDYMSEDAKDAAGMIVDGSAAKEMAKYKAEIKAAKYYKESYVASGMKVTFAQVELSDGTMAYLPKEMSFKEKPEMLKVSEVSVHPAWKTLENVTTAGMKYGFGYMAVDSIVGGFKAGFDRVGNHENVVNNGEYVTRRSNVEIKDSGGASVSGIGSDTMPAEEPEEIIEPIEE